MSRDVDETRLAVCWLLLELGDIYIAVRCAIHFTFVCV